MRRFATFLMVGGANTVVGLSMQYALMWLTHNPYLSNAVAYFIGFWLSFWWHDKLTFGDIEEKSRYRVFPYTVVYIISFIANLLALALLVDVLEISAFIAFIISSGVFAIVSYTLNLNFVFSTAKQS
jgi:putative flippase GtrA